MKVYRGVLDSLSSHIAFLDKDGIILETNKAWQDFAMANGLHGLADCVGVNYFAICDRAAKDSVEGASEIAAGIRKVMAGEQYEFFTQYPCHSPDEKRWFALRAVPCRSPGKAKVIIKHEDITPIMKAQEDLQIKEAELKRQHRELQESNAALKVLLKQMRLDRKQLEEAMLANVKRIILPNIEKLRAARLQERERSLVARIDKSLKDIISPFVNHLSSVNSFLTPQEYQVASMVREGMTSKEIARTLGITADAVYFHRRKLRRKLGLTDTNANLRSYLLSLS